MSKPHVGQKTLSGDTSVEEKTPQTSSATAITTPPFIRGIGPCPTIYDDNLEAAVAAYHARQIPWIDPEPSPYYLSISKSLLPTDRPSNFPHIVDIEASCLDLEAHLTCADGISTLLWNWNQGHFHWFFDLDLDFKFLYEHPYAVTDIFSIVREGRMVTTRWCDRDIDGQVVFSIQEDGSWKFVSCWTGKHDFETTYPMSSSIWGGMASELLVEFPPEWKSTGPNVWESVPLDGMSDVRVRISVVR